MGLLHRGKRTSIWQSLHKYISVLYAKYFSSDSFGFPTYDITVKFLSFLPHFGHFGLLHQVK